MKCVCGQPMRQQVVSLDDIWWTCLICGRSKPVEIEAPLMIPVEANAQPALHWAETILAGKRTRPKRSMTMSTKTLSDLNTALFDQLDRLSQASGETLKTEIERTRATSSLAREIVENAKLVLEAHRTIGGKTNAPKMLEA